MLLCALTNNNNNDHNDDDDDDDGDDCMLRTVYITCLFRSENFEVNI